MAFADLPASIDIGRIIWTLAEFEDPVPQAAFQTFDLSLAAGNDRCRLRMTQDRGIKVLHHIVCFNN